MDKQRPPQQPTGPKPGDHGTHGMPVAPKPVPQPPKK